MIKPNELRIGNLLIHKGNTIVVDGIDNETDTHIGTWLIWVKDVGLSYPIADFQPFPVSPEWLPKFGFSDKGPNDSAKSNWEKEGVLCPSFDSFEGAFYCTDDWGAEYFAYCEYVHQFQNAFFALTGAELEIKLP